MPKTEEEKFLDESLGNILEDEEEEVVETVDDNKLTEEEISALEKQTGKKLTEEEIKELEEKKKEEEKIEIPEELELIDPEKLPKELQPHFKRMFASFTKKMQGIADLTKKAELWDYIQQNPDFLAEKIKPSSGVTRKEGEKEPSEVFLEQLNLPDDNELSPTVKFLAKAVFDLKQGLVEKDQTNARDNFKERLDSFFDKNEGIREDIEFVRTMDRIGVENPGLYKNLDKLKKYASAELGREPKIKQKGTTVDIYKLYKEMKEAKKNKITKPSHVPKPSEIKKPANVKEAMALAEDQLRRERR